jgi:prepilin-type N-terminal cleavage/methylation domain-containing protein
MGIFVGRADNKKSNTRAIGTFRRPSGFTLLELMFAVMLAAVVIAIGSPAFSEFRRSAQLTRDTNEFLASVQRARSEAAKRQRPMSLCVPEDPSAEEPVCSGEPLTDLATSGWLLFEDGNRDCERATDDSEPVLLTRSPFGPLAIAGNSDRACISFAANGFIRNAGDPSVYQLLFCNPLDPRPSAYRNFKLSPSGHARVTRDPDEIADSGLSCPTT